VRLVSDLKGAGYLTSTASVMLLGAVSWKSATEKPLLMGCLVLGMLLSVAGMMLRWRSHRLDQKEKDEQQSRASAQRQRADDFSASRSVPG
jgi:hypothetical protein